MRTVIIKSRLVNKPRGFFNICIGIGHFNLGFEANTTSVRLMLINWHIILHY